MFISSNYWHCSSTLGDSAPAGSFVWIASLCGAQTIALMEYHKDLASVGCQAELNSTIALLVATR
jgi:hypothetical protein